MPLVTTLKKRDRDITKKDFEEAPDIHLRHIDERWHKVDLIPLWNKWIPYYPLQIREIFEDALDKGMLLAVKPKFENELRFELRYPFGHMYNNNSYIAQRLYDFNLTCIEGADMVLPDDMQAGKTGTEIARMFIELDVALGMPEINFQAQLAAGGYVWAKAGAHIRREDCEDILDARGLSEILLQKLEILRPDISHNVYDKAKVYARLSNADDLYKLANLSGDPVPMSEASREDNKMSRVFNFCSAHGRSPSLGKLLLAGEVWRGNMDYSDDMQMRRVRNSLGRFKYAKVSSSAPAVKRSSESELVI